MTTETPTASFTVDGYGYRYDVFGEVDRARMAEDFVQTLELFEQADVRWPWPGSMESELMKLCATAYALGKFEAHGPSDLPQTPPAKAK